MGKMEGIYALAQAVYYNRCMLSIVSVASKPVVAYHPIRISDSIITVDQLPILMSKTKPQAPVITT